MPVIREGEGGGESVGVRDGGREGKGKVERGEGFGVEMGRKEGKMKGEVEE